MTRPRPRSESPATDFSVALLDEFVRLGVRDLVLCPGSRSQALALAAAEFERLGALTLHVRIDERVAGFVALGLAAESRRPVLVVTTSGTAVANLHPAVLEAHHSGVPVIVLSADRPDELRGIGANQTTEQRGIFGPQIPTTDVPAPTGADDEPEYAARIARAAVASARGAVHVNLSFREPLSAAITLDGVDTEWTAPASATPIDPVALEPAAGTVVVAGHDAGDTAERLARELGAPLLAEVSSGARFGPNLVVAYRELLAEPGFGDEVRRAIVMGHPTLSREIPALLHRPDVEVVVVRGRTSEPYDPGRNARIVDAIAVHGEPERSWARPWVGRWVAASRMLLEQPSTAPPIDASRSSTPAEQSAYAKHVLAELRRPVDRRMLVEAVWAATWPHDRLVLGASRLIREADRVVPGKRIRVHANRGLAGIDGTVSTATGIDLAVGAQRDAAGSPRGVTRVLLGDLTLLHDQGGLGLVPGEPTPRLQVVVGNDGGGTIFDGLEVAASADTAALDRVMLTPQRVDFAALAAAHGWEYRRAATRSELDQALTASELPVLIEVPLDR